MFFGILPKKMLLVGLVLSLGGTATYGSSETYNVTIATDNPASPTIGTAGSGGSGFDLRGAILAANASSHTNITINFVYGSAQTITLANHLPMISNYNGASATATPINKNWIFNGNNNVTINGANTYRGFFFSPVPATTAETDLPSSGYTQQLNVTLRDMTIRDVLAKGGDGGQGGGMGAGGAAFVNSYTNLTVNNVNFTNCIARGGNGGSNGSLSTNGGGGMVGNGGNGAGGGGGGLGANGGNTPSSGPGGGGGGIGTIGASPGSSASGGGFGGNGLGQILGTTFTGGTGSGGDGGGISPSGLQGGLGGGGGGSPNNTPTGGNGGFGGGGGGGRQVAGSGGFGGGGGGWSTSGGGGGHGGFGGGGGYGSGGFGGGAGYFTGPGFGRGYGGGDGSSGTNFGGSFNLYNNLGGGGAGLGGALFARSNGSLSIVGPSVFGQGTSNSVAGGTGGHNHPHAFGGVLIAPLATGQDLFIMGTSASATSVPLNTAAGDITFNGSIADDNGNNSSLGGKLVISGSNRVIFNAASTYIGGTDVDGGTASIGHNTALGTGTVRLAAGTTLQARAALTNVANAISLTGNATIDNQTHAMTLSGNITNTVASSLTKINSGILTLGGTSTYSGGTTVSAGTLAFTNYQALGTGGVTLAAGTTLLLGGNIAPANPVANSITLAGNATIDNGGYTGYFSNPITGAFALTLAGSGTTVIAGANTPASTTISAGTLALNTGATLANGITISNGATYDLSRGAANPVLSSVTAASGSNISLGDHTLSLASGTINGNLLDGGLSTFTGAKIKKTGVGTLTLGGTNTYSGGTELDAGIIVASNAAALGTGTATIGTASSAGTLRMGGAYTIANAVALSTAQTSTIDLNGNNTTFSGVFSSGGATLALTNSGGAARIATLTAANTYTGITSIGALTTVALSGAGTLGSSNASFTAATSILDINAITPASITIGDLNGTQGQVVLGAKNLTIGTTATTANFAGVISGVGGSLTKSNTGTATLSGVNTYTGGTAIESGILIAGNAAALGTGTATIGTAGSAGTLRMGGAYTIANAVALSTAQTSTIDLNGNNTTFSGVFSGGGATLALTNSGGGQRIATLTAANTHIGITSIGALTTLELTGSGTLGSSNVSFAAATSILDIDAITPASLSIGDLSGTQGQVALGERT